MTGRDEIQDMKRLLYWIVGLIVSINIVVTGSAFGILFNANADQDTKIDSKISSDIMVRYEEANIRAEDVNASEHRELRQSVSELKDSVGELSTESKVSNEKLENIEGSITEIKELLKEKE